MIKRLMLSTLLILFFGFLALTGCNFPKPTPTPPITPTFTYEPTETLVPTATLTPTDVPTPTPIPPTETPTITPTPTWVYHEAGEVIAPILLYHHVNGDYAENRYSVSIPEFSDQMRYLYDNGYTAITISTLVDVILYGGELPAKPIVITFDDGNIGVYENAFPIMQSYNFPGVFYIVASRIRDVEGFVNVEQINEMADAGWEIGSHSFTHQDITQNHDIADYEIRQSKITLEAALGVDINTFAYPFGEIDDLVIQVTINSLYRAGMGLGLSKTHTLYNLFYLNRIEIQGDYSFDRFVELVSADAE